MPDQTLAEVRYAIQGAVALLELSNPPVNGLGLELRQGLFDSLQRAMGDKAVQAVVLRGAGRMFCGGADIRQFNTPKASASPLLRDVNRLIESSAIPVIAALHGHALGGGLELAMACHGRVAAAGTQLALPEVKLGILPGGGGTQRLPRLVPVERALEMIVSGQAIEAQEAQQLGLVDRIAEQSGLIDVAIRWAMELAAEGPEAVAARVPSRFTPVLRAEATTFFEAARTRIAADYPGAAAPKEIVSCVQAALEMPFEDALTFERSRFAILVDGDESKAMRQAFFAQRQAGKR